MRAILLIGMLIIATYGNVPVFELCSDQGDGVFVVDLTNTYTTPNDVEKGDSITLYVNGLFTDDTTLELLELDVWWEGTFLQNVTAKESDTVSAGMPYTLTFSVDVPSFSPGGSYALTAYVWGEHGGSTSSTHLACLDVTFSL